MKRLRKVVSAEEFKKGTTFWGCTLEEIKSAKEGKESNVWINFELNQRGLECLDIDHMYGSFIADDGVLYICDTDGYEIEVNGKIVDPESDGEYLGPIKLQNYIKKATPAIINKFITEYEIKQDERLNDIIKSMLDAGYEFTDIIESDHLKELIQDII